MISGEVRCDGPKCSRLNPRALDRNLNRDRDCCTEHEQEHDYEQEHDHECACHWFMLRGRSGDECPQGGGLVIQPGSKLQGLGTSDGRVFVLS